MAFTPTAPFTSDQLHDLTATNATIPASEDCEEWQNAQHVLFQLANLCFAISFLAPSNFKHHPLFLRTVVSAGFLFLVLWAGLIVCLPDVFGWNLGFMLINIAYVAHILYTYYPVRFNPELEDVYTTMFKPFKVTRYMFKELISHATLHDLNKGEAYATEEETVCGEKVSILISGRLKTTCEDLFLHYIDPDQFIDSAEYEAITPYEDEKELFQVTYAGTEKCRIISWTSKSIQHFMKQEPFLCAVFTNIIGKDITVKLYQMQEFLMSNPQYAKHISERQGSLISIRNSLLMDKNENAAHVLQRMGSITSCDSLSAFTKGKLRSQSSENSV